MPDAATEPTAESLEIIRKFAETYAKRTGTYFCSEPSVTAVVLKVSQAFWNCPCVPMRERKECHCMLFLTEDNPFACPQKTQTITTETIQATAG
jgi:ferredoxin-thioredoxin reductase catalytic chain